MKKLVIAAEVRNSRLGRSSELSHPASDGNRLPKAEELYLRLVLWRILAGAFSFDGGGFEVDADTLDEYSGCLIHGACATTPAGKLDPKVTNALGSLGASYLRSLEVADIEKAGWMPWRGLRAARRASFCGRANPRADEAGADGKEIINSRASGIFGEEASISNLGLMAPLL